MGNKQARRYAYAAKGDLDETNTKDNEGNTKGSTSEENGKGNEDVNNQSEQLMEIKNTKDLEPCMRLLVKVGNDNLVTVFPKSTTIGEIITQIEEMLYDLCEDKAVKIKALRSNQGMLMKSAVLHELLPDGGQVEVVFAVPPSQMKTPNG